MGNPSDPWALRRQPRRLGRVAPLGPGPVPLGDPDRVEVVVIDDHPQAMLAGVGVERPRPAPSSPPVASRICSSGWTLDAG